MVQHPVYEPQEDSHLLFGVVKKYAQGSVLDMGTGSGIQGLSLIDKHNVTFADVNPLCLEHVKQKIPLKDNANFVLTDLFSNITSTYDTIIFNAPYLPTENDVEDIALDGGAQGYEVTLKFLRDAKLFLNNKGTILLLISQLTKPDVVEKFLHEHGYIFKIVAREKISFDELLVYKIGLAHSHLLVQRRFYAKGNRGVIFRGVYDGVEAIEKARNPAAAVDTIENEIQYLEMLNKHGVGPRLLFHNPHIYIREFIDGQLIEEFVCDAQKKEIIFVLGEVFKQCYIMDRLYINKKEMNHPQKHIIITKEHEVFQIDFERCTQTKKPKNVTQFIQYITGGLSSFLSKKGLIYEREIFLELAKEYKKDFSSLVFNKILHTLNQ